MIFFQIILAEINKSWICILYLIFDRPKQSVKFPINNEKYSGKRYMQLPYILIDMPIKRKMQYRSFNTTNLQFSVLLFVIILPRSRWQLIGKSTLCACPCYKMPLTCPNILYHIFKFKYLRGGIWSINTCKWEIHNFMYEIVDNQYLTNIWLIH